VVMACRDAPSPRLAVAGLHFIAARVRWKDNSVRRLAQKFGYSGIMIYHRMLKAGGSAHLLLGRD